MVQPNGSDVVVVGGGLGGLAAATYLARSGRTVTLFEKSRALGGRAMTQANSDFRFNLGPHALYRAGAGIAVLKELGVPFSGRTPSVSGAYGVSNGSKHALPGGFVSLLTTSLLRLSGKLEAARLLASVQQIDAHALERVSVRDWLREKIHQPDVRGLIQALLRLSTYTHDPDRQSAGAAVAQLQLALRTSVLYLDGGWQTLVDGLLAAARASGVQIVSSTRVDQIEADLAVRGVRLADGAVHPAAAVIIAAGPAEAAALVPSGRHTALHDWAAAAIPVKAACLDVALAHLPRPRATFALGIDRPLYLSVHSAVALLAPAGGATIHVAKYLGADDGDAKATERELEALLDLIQPGWRDVIVERRFLPNMIVSHALVTAAAGGVAGRPGPVVPDVPNLYVVGDWVGPEGQLADASLASAKQAARLMTTSETQRPAAAA